MPRYMGCGNLPISDFRTLAMIFHPLITLPTEVRSARILDGIFSVLLEDESGFEDVGIGVFVGTSTFLKSDKLQNSAFFASSVRLLFSGFRFPFTVCGMNQISEFNKELLLHRLDTLFQFRGLEHRNHQLIVLRL